MALIECKKCGHKISDKAYNCIYCGCSMEEALGKEPLKKAIKEVLSSFNNIENAKELVQNKITYIIRNAPYSFQRQSNGLIEFYTKGLLEKIADYIPSFSGKKDYLLGINKIENIENLHHIFCYTKKIDNPMEYELYYVALNCYFVIKAMIRKDSKLGDKIKYEICKIDALPQCIFTDLFQYITEKQLEKYVPIMKNDIFYYIFGNTGYPDVNHELQLHNNSFSAKKIPKEYIINNLKIDVQNEYYLCFFSKGSIAVTTRLSTDDCDETDKQYLCYQKRLKEKQMDGFDITFYPLYSFSGEKRHIYGFFKDHKIITKKIKNNCEILNETNEIDMFHLKALLEIIKNNILNLIVTCEENCNQIRLFDIESNDSQTCLLNVNLKKELYIEKSNKDLDEKHPSESVQEFYTIGEKAESPYNREKKSNFIKSDYPDFTDFDDDSIDYDSYDSDGSTDYGYRDDLDYDE